MTSSNAKTPEKIDCSNIDRYYLEPATPLKSIANTAQLTTQTAKPQSSDITSLTNGMKLNLLA